MRTATPPILVTILLLSGCLGIGLEDLPTGSQKIVTTKTDSLSPQMLKVRELLANTTCEPSAPPAATSANLKLLSTFKAPTSLYSNAPMPSQIDTYRNRTAIAFFNANHYALINTTDPTKPVVHSTWLFLLPTGNLLEPKNIVPYTHVWDVQFSSDGNNVIVAVNNRLYAMDVTTRVSRFNAQGGFLDLPPDYGGQALRIAVHPINGIDHVFVAPGATGSGLYVARLSGTGFYAKLDPVGLVVGPGGQTTSRASIQPSDLHVRTEWLNGGNHTLLYAANGPHGILILDVTQPTRPELIGTIAAPSPQPGSVPPYYSSIHVANVDGKRLLIANQIGSQSALKVWDLTDFKTPKPLAAWTLDPARPAQPQAEITVANNTLFLAHQAQGVWGFDLSKFLQDPKAGLKAILHFQPPAGGSANDVTVEDGLIHVSDPLAGSTHIIGYGCFPAGDMKFSSTG